MLCEKSINLVNECHESVVRKISSNMQIFLKKLPKMIPYVLQSYIPSSVHVFWLLQSTVHVYRKCALNELHAGYCQVRNNANVAQF
jgi:hypothetical protein